MTVTRFENNQSRGYAETVHNIQSTLENAGIKFTESGCVCLSSN